MKMNKTMNLFIVFVAILVIAFFAIGFSATITAPSNTTAAGQQYENLTQAVEISNIGLTSALLLVIIGMVLAAVYAAFSSRRR